MYSFHSGCAGFQSLICRAKTIVSTPWGSDVSDERSYAFSRYAYQYVLFGQYAIRIF